MKVAYNSFAPKVACVDTPPEPGVRDISNRVEANEDTVNIDFGDEEDLLLATDVQIFGKTLLTDEMKTKAFTGDIDKQSNSEIRKDCNFVQSFDISGKDITNVMNNDGQRHFICCILRYWIEYDKASQLGPSTTAMSTTRVDTRDKFVGFLSGVAGGGKSYVLDLVCDIYMNRCNCVWRKCCGQSFEASKEEQCL